MKKGQFYLAAIVCLVLTLAIDNVWLALMCLFACGVFTAMGHVHSMMQSYKAHMTQYKNSLEEAFKSRIQELETAYENKRTELQAFADRVQDEMTRDKGDDDGTRHAFHDSTHAVRKSRD